MIIHVHIIIGHIYVINVQENDMDTRDWSERCFDTINLRNPFELRAEDLPEQPNYFTCAFRKDKMDK